MRKGRREQGKKRGTNKEEKNTHMVRFNIQRQSDQLSATVGVTLSWLGYSNVVLES